MSQIQRSLIVLRFLLIALLTGCAGEQSFPPESQILARNTSGDWLNIDFKHTGAPLEEAQRCVRSHRDAEAVACFAFASEEAYMATQPIEAGNFAGPLCWDARWQRNKGGTESGGTNNARPSSCLPGGAASEAPVIETESTPASVPGPIEVTIEIDIERDSQGRLRISGTTNLPDQTRLSFSLSQAATNFLAQDSGEVVNGRFESSWFSRQGGPLTAGVYEVGVTVPIYNTQPQSVQRRLGPGLELMTGPLVEQASLEFMGKVASIRRIVEIE